MTIAIAIGIFFTIVLLVEGGYYFYHQHLNPQSQMLKRRLRGASQKIEDSPTQNDVGDIHRHRKLSDLPWLNELLTSLPSLKGLEKKLQQANSQMPISVFFLLSAVLGAGGALLVVIMDYGLLVGVGASAVGCAAPLLWVNMERTKRFKKFERQLPEALDLMARALRAGHAFSVGMKMVGDEFPDPIGPELNRTVEEISFGIDVQEAMNNLNERVVSSDLKFFITALIVQRETGGNLAEIIEAISRLIRQRFELFERVKALASEGILSGIVLFAMPFVMGGVLWVMNEEYMRLLVDDPTGHMMLGVSGVLMVFGAIVMKKLCNIQV